MEHLEGGGEAHGDHHPPSWVEKATGIGAVVAIIGAAITFLAWLFDALPYAKAIDVVAIEKRVTAMEGSFKNLDIGQKETQELQLMDRVQALDDRLAKMLPGAPDYVEFRQQRVAAQQRLSLVQNELAQARASGRQ